jgi:hypothetical protein
MKGLQIYLSAEEVEALRASLDYSIRSVEDWWARFGQPETAEVGREKVADLRRLRDKLKAASRN